MASPEPREADHDEFPEQTEAFSPDPPDNDEPDHHDADDDEEAGDAETPDTAEPTTPAPADLRRVQALLEQALRLGRQYGLVQQDADGTLVLPGQRGQRRDTSDCTCPQCKPYAQQHWWCIWCNSGPHDWTMVSPQLNKLMLNPGGIDGVRHACCSLACAKDYLGSRQRLPSGTRPEARSVDPSLALPGV